jgi:hypothetical protein
MRCIQECIQEHISGSCFLLFSSFLSPIIYLYFSGTHEERKPCAVPLKVPSYLVDVFQKPEEWMETPQLRLMQKTRIRSI